MKTLQFFKGQTTRRKSIAISLSLHASLLLLGLIPLASHLEMQQVEAEYVIPIEFAEFAQSSNTGLMAKSPVPDPEHKPVVERREETPAVVESEQVSEVAQVIEEVQETESEVIEEQVEEVAAAEDTVPSDDTETASEGGSESTRAEGPVEGTDVSGEDTGQNGLDGDGVITRKIIYRQDIKQAARHSGTIVVDLCIDRKGRVLTVANNDENTTIADMDMVRHALQLAAGYRFEIDYSAAKRECGSLTFIFDIEGDTQYVDYAMSE